MLLFCSSVQAKERMRRHWQQFNQKESFFFLMHAMVYMVYIPFMYDLNQIPYDYTVEVRNRFKGLDLRDREPDELCTEVRDIVQETGIKTIPMEKNCKKAKWLSEEDLHIAGKEEK